MKLSIFILGLIILSCSNASKISQDKNTIVGKWRVVDAKFIGNPYQVNPPKKVNIYSFFGPENWNESKDKYFEFYENGKWTTDLVSNEIVNSFDLKYNFEKNIYMNASMINGDSTKYDFEVNVLDFSNTKMVWDIDEFIQITLVRE